MDFYTVVQNEIDRNQELYARMDRTRDLLNLEPYVMRNFEGAAISRVINVRPNRPATFTNALVESLIGALYQMEVEGNVSIKQKKNLERYINDSLAQTDEYLVNRFGLTSLNAWLSNHACTRGRIGVRWMARIVDGKLVIECLPMDMRYTPYEFGANGLADGWYCNRTWRYPSQIMVEYPQLETELKKHDANTKLEVRDCWEAEKNELYVVRNSTDYIQVKRGEGDELLYLPNPYGRPPAAIAVAPSGFMFRDDGYGEHEGEDVLMLNRDLYDMDALATSIQMTYWMNVLFPGTVNETKTYDATPAQTPPKIGESKKYREGEAPVPFQLGEVNDSALQAFQNVLKQIKEGGMSDVDYDRFATTPPSALLVMTESEIRGKLLNSRIECLRVFREQLARLMIEEYKTLNADELLIGPVGSKNKYSHMPDPENYTIKCKIMTKSRRLDFANMTMALSMMGSFPPKYIFENILQVDDPDGLMDELEAYKARMADPAIGMFERAISLARSAHDLEDEVEADAKKIESKMETERLVQLIKARRNQPNPQMQVPEQAAIPSEQSIKTNPGNMVGPMFKEANRTRTGGTTEGV